MPQDTLLKPLCVAPHMRLSRGKRSWAQPGARRVIVVWGAAHHHPAYGPRPLLPLPLRARTAARAARHAPSSQAHTRRPWRVLRAAWEGRARARARLWQRAALICMTSCFRRFGRFGGVLVLSTGNVLRVLGFGPDSTGRAVNFARATQSTRLLTYTRTGTGLVPPSIDHQASASIKPSPSRIFQLRTRAPLLRACASPLAR